MKIKLKLYKKSIEILKGWEGFYRNGQNVRRTVYFASKLLRFKLKTFGLNFSCKLSRLKFTKNPTQ